MKDCFKSILVLSLCKEETGKNEDRINMENTLFDLCGFA